MTDFRKNLKKTKENSEKLQEDLDFFIQMYENKCLEEDDKKQVIKDIEEIRKDLSILKNKVKGIAIIRKR